MQEITIVTAFFDIGRKNFKEKPRTNSKYAEFFEFWARMKNNIVVYTDEVMAEEVKRIRSQFDLLEKTKIVIVDDFRKIEPKTLSRLENINKTSDFINYRYMDNSADNNPLYNYIMLLKAWCINDAVEKGYAKGMIAWLDFGYNHGGAVFQNSDEFDFLWSAEVNKDKITMFSLKEDDNKPIFRIVESYEVYIMGAPFILPDKLANKFWTLINDSLNSLLDCGFMDDDQTLMLMASRKEPDLFNIIKSDWFMPLKQCGGEHLTMKKKESKVKFTDRVLYKYRVFKRNRNHFKRLKKIFYKDYLD